MRAMVLEEVKKPLVLQDLPLPEPLTGQVRIKVKACSVCRTDLHIFDGELKNPKLPLVMGHQIVGIVEEDNSLVGIPWLGKSCGICPYCKRGEENLCDDPTFTGYNINGGFAEYVVAYKEFVFPLPKGYSEINAAP
ncbi:MAG: alcohol dehydrogenase, partial [Chlamydiae bacterium]|nr:alcohol dehydrogenase [Chlamydiota bacterium]